MTFLRAGLLVLLTAATLAPEAAFADLVDPDAPVVVELAPLLGASVDLAATNCTFAGVDITVGELTGSPVREPNGDIHYDWSAPADVRVNGDCDDETHSRVTYVDDVVVGMGARERSPTYVERGRGQVTVSQAPHWRVLYYGVGGVYARSVSGKLVMIVEGSFIANGTEYRLGWCRRKTWYFTATPTGPRFERSTTEAKCTMT